MDHRCLLDTPDEELPSSRFRKAKVYVDCNSFGPRSIEAAVRLYGADASCAAPTAPSSAVTGPGRRSRRRRSARKSGEQILHAQRRRDDLPRERRAA